MCRLEGVQSFQFVLLRFNCTAPVKPCEVQGQIVNFFDFLEDFVRILICRVQLWFSELRLFCLSKVEEEINEKYCLLPSNSTF